TASNFFPRQPMNVVLKRIRNKAIAEPDPGFALVGEPLFFRNQFVHERIEIVVVRKLNVPADVPKKTLLVTERRRQTSGVIVRFQQTPIALTQLVKTPGGAEPSGAATEDENLHG